jgi:hypothetical protein
MRLALATIAVCFVLSISVAQDRPAGWVTSGDSLADFAVRFEGREPDLSTAHNCVYSFTGVAARQVSQTNGLGELEPTLATILNAELKPAIDKHLAPDLRKPAMTFFGKYEAGAWISWAIHDHGKEVIWPADHADVKEGDEIVLVATQGGRTPNPGGGETEYAFLCRKVGDTWLIAGIREKREFAVRNVGTGGPARPNKRTWEDVDPGFAYAAAAVYSLPELPKAEGASGKAAVEIIRELWYRRVEVRSALVAKVFAAHLEALKPMLLPAYVEAREAAAAKVKGRVAGAFTIVEERELAAVIQEAAGAKRMWLLEFEEHESALRVKSLKRRTITKRDGEEVESLADEPMFWHVPDDQLLRLTSLGVLMPT